MRSVLGIFDNPLAKTGFANVGHQIMKKFVDEGFRVEVLGTVYSMPDVGKKLPYILHHVSALDEGRMGFDMMRYIIKRVNPDLIWILTDPGNLHHYLEGEDGLLKILEDIKGNKPDMYGNKEFKIMSYTPIEGDPQSAHAIESLQRVADNGLPVYYCQNAVKTVAKHWPLTPMEYVWHGLDHAPFDKYSDQERRAIRHLIGLEDDTFLVGVFGVNKRTKGFAETIQVAKYIKEELKPSRKIIFYFHTEWNRPIMGGHNLWRDVKSQGVLDMILLKPDINSKEYWSGVPSDQSAVVRATELAGEDPIAMIKYKHWSDSDLIINGVNMSLLAQYDFITRLNMLDLYFDPSSVEGWGLIPGEAMACGVPVLSFRDYGPRDEVYGSYRIEFEPLCARLWSTWHTGAKLVRFDPAEAAKHIVLLSEDQETLDKYSALGLDLARRYSWDEQSKKMVGLARRILNI